MKQIKKGVTASIQFKAIRPPDGQQRNVTLLDSSQNVLEELPLTFVGDRIGTIDIKIDTIGLYYLRVGSTDNPIEVVEHTDRDKLDMLVSDVAQPYWITDN